MENGKPNLMGNKVSTQWDEEFQGHMTQSEAAGFHVPQVYINSLNEGLGLQNHEGDSISSCSNLGIMWVDNSISDSSPSTVLQDPQPNVQQHFPMPINMAMGLGHNMDGSANIGSSKGQQGHSSSSNGSRNIPMNFNTALGLGSNNNRRHADMGSSEGLHNHFTLSGLQNQQKNVPQNSHMPEGVAVGLEYSIDGRYTNIGLSKALRGHSIPSPRLQNWQPNMQQNLSVMPVNTAVGIRHTIDGRFANSIPINIPIERRDANTMPINMPIERRDANTMPINMPIDGRYANTMPTNMPIDGRNANIGSSGLQAYSIPSARPFLGNRGLGGVESAKFKSKFIPAISTHNCPLDTATDFEPGSSLVSPSDRVTSSIPRLRNSGVPFPTIEDTGGQAVLRKSEATQSTGKVCQPLSNVPVTISKYLGPAVTAGPAIPRVKGKEVTQTSKTLSRPPRKRSANKCPPATPPAQIRRTLPLNHINWQGSDTCSTAVKCLLCKRDLSYAAEGPFYQPATPPAVAILPCGHIFHDYCLQNITPKDQSKDPPCLPCALGEI